MPTFKYAKLVRDKIWGWHEDEGHTVSGTILVGPDLIDALTVKLHEEADEVKNAISKKELTEEIADVQQILDDIATTSNIQKEEIETMRAQKQAKKGGFEGGYYIENVYMPDESDKWVDHCRQNSKKYPELQASGKVDPDLPELEKGTYRHSKSGKLYEVVAVTFNTETYQPLVIYKPMYEHDKYEMLARPYEVFTEQVNLDGEIKPRFEKLPD